MRAFGLLLGLPLAACATPVADDHAGPGPEGRTDASVGPDTSTGEASPPDAPGDASEASSWPGSCDDGEAEDCYTGPVATKDVGACKHGTHTCVAGHFPATCDGELLPAAAEACNGVDDDCDGTIDEGCACTDGDSKSCYGGPAGTEGVGPCKGGTQTCAGGAWGPCGGAVLPGVETCNGVDDDCDGTVDDDAGLFLYSAPFTAGTSWSRQRLSDAWTGTNAPPRCADVMGTVQLTDIGRLLVFTSDGKLYRRTNGAWAPPEAAAVRFPSLPATFESVYQVPSMIYPGSPPGADLTFTAAPYAYLYHYDQNDSVGDFTKVATEDGTPQGGPNQAASGGRWALEQFASSSSFMLYFEYDDGKVYGFDANFAWTSWPVAQSPLWAGRASTPPIGACVAGYADHAPDRAYLVCP